jgi:hypothetical protein
MQASARKPPLKAKPLKVATLAVSADIAPLLRVPSPKAATEKPPLAAASAI